MSQVWQQYKGYIIVLLILLLARFVWQPLWQSRQDNWQQLQYSENARHKAQALLTLGDDMQQAQQQIQTLLATAESKLGTANDLTRYKLQIQQQLEQLFATHQLQITLSSWRDGIADSGIQTLVLDLRFSGKAKNYLKLLHQLQHSAIIPSMVIIEQQLTMRAQTPDSMGTADGNMSLRLAVTSQEAE
ncbi:hypothetical protein WG68_03280 [Arsukibacterium ikkense]|uniref:Uncharacterized protein n=1 Tax=Arsukibacterium ikkense TaxID=336831 RepID=A0A0M2V953_9GAMM|nr:hypothetical protein [Arsukibacterium ikkense]KKO46969.1 hypothetical protein WG68_03280 [Arsukibacterium ikkense]